MRGLVESGALAPIPAGWRVEGEAGAYVPAGRFHLSVRSGVDWFDVEGGVDFGGEVASFPQLLSALRSGRGYVRLGHGSIGLLPEEWLRRHGLLLAAGEKSGDALRFKPSQALILDLLLASEAEVKADAGFEKVREKWRTFEGIRPLDAPPGFKGELREYQRVGLGWMRFLRECGLGGVLADDMGLGKTVQALAYLELRRREGASPLGRPRTSSTGPTGTRCHHRRGCSRGQRAAPGNASLRR